MITWNCPDCVKLPFTTFIASIACTSAFFGSTRANLIRVIQCETAAMFSFPPTRRSSSFVSSEYLPIFLIPPFLTCLNKFFYYVITHLFEHVKTFSKNLFEQVIDFFAPCFYNGFMKIYRNDLPEGNYAKIHI